MQRHLVLTTDDEFQEIISGRMTYLVRFFKKKFEFLFELSSDDLVFLKKGKEVLGQFNVGKIIMIEELEIKDLRIVNQFVMGMSEEDFVKRLDENRVMVIVQIEKLEQFITSPVDLPKSKKEWIVLD
jgi:hypothetical protein